MGLRLRTEWRKFAVGKTGQIVGFDCVELAVTLSPSRPARQSFLVVLGPLALTIANRKSGG